MADFSLFKEKKQRTSSLPKKDFEIQEGKMQEQICVSNLFPQILISLIHKNRGLAVPRIKLITEVIVSKSLKDSRDQGTQKRLKEAEDRKRLLEKNYLFNLEIWGYPVILALFKIRLTF